MGKKLIIVDMLLSGACACIDASLLAAGLHIIGVAVPFGAITGAGIGAFLIAFVSLAFVQGASACDGAW